MKLVIGFGSIPFEGHKGGLIRVSQLLFEVGCQNCKFLFFGKQLNLSDERFVELPWEGKNLLIRLLSLSLSVIYVTFSRYKSVMVHGSPILLLSAVFSRSRTRYFVHGDLSLEYEYLKDRGLSERIRYFLICSTQKWAFSYFSRFNVYNYDLTKLLLGKGKNVTDIPNFLSGELLSTASNSVGSFVKQKTIKVVIVSRFVRRKNFEKSVGFLINLASVVKVEVTVIGNVDREYMDVFSTYFDKLLEVASISVRRLEGCTDGELYKAYAESDFLLHPAKAEGFPLSAQEALCFGCLVVGYTSVLKLDCVNDFIIDIDDAEADLMSFLSVLENIVRRNVSKQAISSFRSESYFKALDNIQE